MGVGQYMGIDGDPANVTLFGERPREISSERRDGVAAGAQRVRQSDQAGRLSTTVTLATPWNFRLLFLSRQLRAAALCQKSTSGHPQKLATHLALCDHLPPLRFRRAKG